MQSLDIISVNLWQILISLANLFILFLILKKFLYKPVKNTLAKRKEQIDLEYSEAADAKEKALSDKAAYEEKLSSADSEAGIIIKKATDYASAKEKEMIDEAKAKAQGIIKRAEADAELERKKAREDIKREIVDVSTLLSAKMLEREVSTADHEQLINSFIEKIGENNEAN